MRRETEVLVVSAFFPEPACAGDAQFGSHGLHSFRLKFAGEGVLAPKDVDFVACDGVDALRLIQNEGRTHPVELWRDEELLCVISRSNQGLFRLA